MLGSMRDLAQVGEAKPVADGPKEELFMLEDTAVILNPLCYLQLFCQESHIHHS